MIPLEVTSSVVSPSSFSASNRRRQRRTDDDDDPFVLWDSSSSPPVSFVSFLYHQIKTRTQRYRIGILLFLAFVIIYYVISTITTTTTTWNTNQQQQQQPQEVFSSFSSYSKQMTSIVSLSNAACAGAQQIPIDGSIVIGVTGRVPSSFLKTTTHSSMVMMNSTTTTTTNENDDCLMQLLSSNDDRDDGGNDDTKKKEKRKNAFWRGINNNHNDHNNPVDTFPRSTPITTTAWYSFEAPAVGRFRAWLDQDIFRLIDEEQETTATTSEEEETSRLELYIFSNQQQQRTVPSKCHHEQQENYCCVCCTCHHDDDDDDDEDDHVWKSVSEETSSNNDLGFEAQKKGESFRIAVVHYHQNYYSTTAQQRTSSSSSSSKPPNDIQRRFALKVLFTPRDSRLYHPPKATSRCTVANPLVFLPEQPFRELIGSTVLLEKEEDANNDSDDVSIAANTETEREIVPNCWNATSTKDDDERLYLPPTGAWYTLTTTGITNTAKLLRITLDEKQSKRLERPAFISVFESSDCHELINPPPIMSQLQPGTNVSSPACVDGTYTWQQPKPISNDDDDIDDIDDNDDSMLSTHHHPMGTVVWQSKPNTTYKILVHLWNFWNLCASSGMIPCEATDCTAELSALSR